MNNIISQYLTPDGASRQRGRSDLSTMARAEEFSFKARESTSSDLIIETREGDRVTLSASSFSQMDAYSYTSEGLARTESGAVLYSMQERQITLASGQSFSFSVDGDLSESELEDIEAILKGLDGVMAEMREGDMTDAMEKALAIGSLETVSSYSADLSYSASYEMHSRSATSAQYLVPGDPDVSPDFKTLPEAEKTTERMDGPRSPFDRFFDKLLKQLQAHDNQLLKKATSPIGQLFKHHLGELEGGPVVAQSLFDGIDEAREKIIALLEEMTPEVIEGPRVENGERR